MIRDAENTFFYKKDLNGTETTGIYSDVIEVGKGNAVVEPWIEISLQDKIVGGTTTITLQTATDAGFTTPVDLAEIKALTTSPVGKLSQMHIPHGNLGYLRLKVVPAAALTGGTITAVFLIDTTLK